MGGQSLNISQDLIAKLKEVVLVAVTENNQIRCEEIAVDVQLKP